MNSSDITKLKQCRQELISIIQNTHINNTHTCNNIQCFPNLFCTYNPPNSHHNSHNPPNPPNPQEPQTIHEIQ
jgi:hypothetical protein